MMKFYRPLLLSFVLLTGIQFGLNAQSTEYLQAGIKGGINLSNIAIDNNFSVNVDKSLATKTGYLVGAYARVGKKMFLQPEVFFSAKDYEVNALNALTKSNDVVSFSQKSIDVPILVGLKLGPVRVLAGPVASYSFSADASANNALKTYFSGTPREISNRSNFSYQAGIGLDILSLSLDVRYQGAISELSNTIAIPTGFNYAQKPSFFQATLGLRIL
jgi:hypothetical protein